MNDHVTGGGLKARIRKPRPKPKKPRIERALYQGEIAAASGDFNYFVRLAEVQRDVVVRSAAQNSYVSLIEWADRILADDPARAVILYFPKHKQADYRRAAASAASVWRAEFPFLALVARDDCKTELVVRIDDERLVVRGLEPA